MEAVVIEVSLNDLVVVRAVPFQPVVDVPADEESPGSMLVEMLQHLVGRETLDHLLLVQYAGQAAQRVTGRLQAHGQMAVFLPPTPGVDRAYLIVYAMVALLYQRFVEGVRNAMAGGTMRVEVVQHRVRCLRLRSFRAH